MTVVLACHTQGGEHNLTSGESSQRTSSHNEHHFLQTFYSIIKFQLPVDTVQDGEVGHNTVLIEYRGDMSYTEINFTLKRFTSPNVALTFLVTAKDISQIEVVFVIPRGFYKSLQVS